jgi:hypothetical protein
MGSGGIAALSRLGWLLEPKPRMHYVILYSYLPSCWTEILRTDSFLGLCHFVDNFMCPVVVWTAHPQVYI